MKRVTIVCLLLCWALPAVAATQAAQRPAPARPSAGEANSGGGNSGAGSPVGAMPMPAAIATPTPTPTDQTPDTPTSPELMQLIAPGATVEKVVGGFGSTNGPVWGPDGSLYFTDTQRDQIEQWTAQNGVAMFREPGGIASGLTFDRQNRLIACETGNRRVSRTLSDDRVVAVADRYDGRPLDGPRDAVMGHDDSIYFVDAEASPGIPEIRRGTLPFQGVYRIASNGRVIDLSEAIQQPSGLAFSPDTKTLYVIDSLMSKVQAFDVLPDGGIANQRLFALVRPWSDEVKGQADGVKVDALGNVFVAGPGGIWVFDPSGKRLGVIAIPEVARDCAFGDDDFKSLYITAGTSVYRIKLVNAGNK